MIRQKHGIAGARKINMVQSDAIQDVTIIDGCGEVKLSLTSSSYPAGLTPEQARSCLSASRTQTLRHTRC